MVEPKKDIGELLFGGGEDKEKVKETTYYCSQWRRCVIEAIEPQIDEYIRKQQEQLVDVSESSVAQYIEQLEMALGHQQRTKKNLVATLSEDELLLQTDTDWLTHFEEAIKEIQEENHGNEAE